MPLYRLELVFFLNDFIQTCFYGHNQPEVEYPGLPQRDIFVMPCNNKQFYVIAKQGLTAKAAY
jgi:hypothetical protein